MSLSPRILLHLACILMITCGVLAQDEGDPGNDVAEPPAGEPSIAAESGSEADEWDEDFGELSIEQLMEIEVTSVAGVEQSLMTSPSAIYVITAEDIRRTGHRSIAEALRMAPGYNVARINATQWAISARGFNEFFSDKLLVLIDGRTVYEPLYAGTFWETQDVLLEDIDRIEVIRGPGATLWGANAVNGVINVTTKSARDTQGLYLTGGGGTEEQGFGAIRYGGQVAENTYYRIWSQYHNHDGSVDLEGNDQPDDWDMWRGGVRVDWHGSDGRYATIDADTYWSDQIGELVKLARPGHLTFDNVVDDMSVSGGHALFRIGEDTSDHVGWSLQGCYDRTNRNGFGRAQASRDTFDLDFRHLFRVGDHHNFVWGLGIRHVSEKTVSNRILAFDPPDRDDITYTGFIQDTISLVPDKLDLMVGSKLESNDYTGFEFQPSARLSWQINQQNFMWGAASRAVRRPARINDDVRFINAYVDTGLATGGTPSGVFAPLVITGDGNNESEVLLAYELGYRVKPTEKLSIDATTFYNHYDKLLAIFPQLQFGNRMTAESYGAEIAAVWQASDNWRLSASYTGFQLQVHSPGADTAEDDQPHHQFNVLSFLDLTEDLELNTAAYFTDVVENRGAGSNLRFDIGLTWRPKPNLELAIWGQNLLDPSHREYDEEYFQPAPREIERAVYAQLTIRF